MFRPCIDLHEGKVKQIVGGTLGAGSGLRTNFVSERRAAWFAGTLQARRPVRRPRHHARRGQRKGGAIGVAAFPGGLQIGGGVNTENARGWLDAGASHVIVTSWVFRDGRLDEGRLKDLVRSLGRERIVLDLSCRRRGDEYFVVTDRWREFTDLVVEKGVLESLAGSCAEFLIHAVDVEGLCRGIDEALVERLGREAPLPVTYAGGARSMADLETVTRLGGGRVDLTIGSALDIFGGTGVRYEDLVAYNRRLSQKAGA